MNTLKEVTEITTEIMTHHRQYWAKQNLYQCSQTYPPKPKWVAVPGTCDISSPCRQDVSKPMCLACGQIIPRLPPGEHTNAQSDHWGTVMSHAAFEPCIQN